MNVGNVSGFNTVTTLKVWVSHVLPLVYDDTLSFMELLGKVTYKLNELIENNNKLPDYIADLIREYISSGEIEKVLAEVLANYMLNVKFPPAGLTPATGDGSADDTEAIQGCIDYAFNHGGMAIYFPSGSYLTQPLVLKNKCTMFGYDRYNTRLVLKGGATTAMFTGNVDELTLTGMGFDGNMDIQVNNVNLFDVTVGSAIITNVLLTDGYDLLKVVVNRDLQLDDVIFNHAVENGLVVSGNGYVQADNVIFKSVSALIGKNYVVLGCNDSILTKVKCEGASPNGVRVTGNNNVVKMWNEACTTAYVDEGENNSVEVYTVSEVKNFTGSVKEHAGGTIVRTAGSDVSETNGGKRTVQVIKDYEETIGADKRINVTGGFNEVVSGDKDVTARNVTDNALVDRIVKTGGNENVNVTGTATKDVVGVVTEKYHNNLVQSVGGNKQETVTGEKHTSAENVSENVNDTKTVNAGSLIETIDDKSVHAGVSEEVVTGEKTETVGSKREVVNGDKTVTAQNSIESIAGDKTVDVGETYHEDIKGNKSVNADTVDVTGTSGTKILGKRLSILTDEAMQYSKPTNSELFGVVPMFDVDNEEYELLTRNDGTAKIANMVNYCVNVLDFGADPTGIKDSAKAIQDAINSVPDNGGVVLIPIGVYSISKTITIGNGTKDKSSTKNCIKIIGANNAATNLATWSGNNGTKLVYKGAENVPMFRILGPILDVVIESVSLWGGSVASNGIYMTCCGQCKVNKVTITDVKEIGLFIDVWDNLTVSGTANNIQCEFTNLFINTAFNDNAICIKTKAYSTTPGVDTNMCSFRNLFLLYSGNGGTGLYLGFIDATLFQSIHLYKNGETNNSHSIVFDGTELAGYPHEICFYNISPSTDGYEVKGEIGKVTFYQLMVGDGAPIPNHKNISGITSTGKIFGNFYFGNTILVENGTPAIMLVANNVGKQTRLLKNANYEEDYGTVLEDTTKGVVTSLAIVNNSLMLDGKEVFNSKSPGGLNFVGLALQNEWVGLLQYAKDNMGRLYIKGNLTPGTKTWGTVIATLPAGFHPKNWCCLTGFDTTGEVINGIVIDTNGEIKIFNPASTSDFSGSTEFNQIFTLM